MLYFFYPVRTFFLSSFYFLTLFLSMSLSLSQTQNTVFSTVNPLASSFTSSITSSLASSVGSDSSSPTTLSTMNAKATPFYPGSNTVESVIGEEIEYKLTTVLYCTVLQPLDFSNVNHTYVPFSYRFCSGPQL